MNKPKSEESVKSPWPGELVIPSSSDSILAVYDFLELSMDAVLSGNYNRIHFGNTFFTIAPVLTYITVIGDKPRLLKLG